MIKDRTGDTRCVELRVKEQRVRRKSIPESQRDGPGDGRCARKSKIGGTGGEESVL